MSCSDITTALDLVNIKKQITIAGIYSFQGSSEMALPSWLLLYLSGPCLPTVTVWPFGHSFQGNSEILKSIIKLNVQLTNA